MPTVIPIPAWVKSVPSDVSIHINELKRKVGTRQYVLLEESDDDLNLIACPHSKDIAFYAAYYDIFRGSDSPPDKRLFFNGIVYDARELPYEVAAGEMVVVIYQTWFVQVFETMAKAVGFLNDFITRCEIEDVSNFVIIVGFGYGSGVLAAVNNKIEEYLKSQ